MNKEFIPYEQALALKEIEFDEPCVYYVDKDNNSYIYNFQTHPDEFIEGCGVNVIPTPTLSQAFRWFRERYSLYSHIRESYAFDNTLGFVSQINGSYVNHGIVNKPINRFETYEEAELECLKKLINIVKKNKL